VISGAAMLALAIGIVWFAPPVPFLLAAQALVLLGTIELGRLARASGLQVPLVPAWIAAALACAASSRAVIVGPMPLDVVLLAALVALGALVLGGWRGDHAALGSAAASFFPALYLGLPLGALVAIRQTHGAAVLFLLMATVVVSDTAQYYAGRGFGRRPLAPAVSPKKTVEGAIGGFIAGPIFFAAAGSWWLPGVSLGTRAIMGIAIVVLGITGDLFESMLKRSAGVKDSAHLIPGHGGVLDRIDALLFAAPAYYILLAFAGAMEP
jgi:phosphatidate cytidylyltransferase